MNPAGHLQHLETQRESLNAQERLLRLLPSALELSSFFFSGGRWHLHVVGPTAALLAMLPPCDADVVLRDQSWFLTPKPGAVNWERRLLPLWSTASSLCWYHQLDEDLVVQVSIKNGRLPEVEGYETLHSAHTVVLGRKLVPLEPRKSLLQHAQDRWEVFCEQEQYTAKQLRFARALRAAHGRLAGHIRKEMLPCPAPTQLLLAGTTFELRHSGHAAPAEKMPADSPLQSLPSIGQFWDSFSIEQADKLLAFVNEQPKNLKEKDDEEARAALQRIKELVAEFSERYLGAMRNAPDTAVLSRWILEQTGHAVTVYWGLRQREACGHRETWVGLGRWHESVGLALPLRYEPSGFDWQNPPFYQYEPNQGHF